MKVNEKTRQSFAYRRFAKKMALEGYEAISESGHPLWQFIRGGRWKEKIIDAKVDPTGSTVFIKAGPR